MLEKGVREVLKQAHLIKENNILSELIRKIIEDFDKLPFLTACLYTIHKAVFKHIGFSKSSMLFWPFYPYSSKACKAFSELGYYGDYIFTDITSHEIYQSILGLLHPGQDV